MTDLIATVLPDDDAPPAALIVNDGFFPDVDPAAFREQLRVRESVTDPRAREALIAAIMGVGRDLATWSVTQRASGHTRLADVPAPKIDGTSRLELLYRRAVFTLAKAELVERYRDVELTPRGDRKAEDLDPSVSELRRDSLYAIRDMLDVTRVAVELI
ncbi:head completion/stabilization protein [uncultured Sphingomonas sp.]|uniref:head completion/stabilization protein n=1 Tax=uncultured Sphingomonas sp. TaxID=158754 RepID=UPI00261CF52D|nr:head completion/stabilization protein [uncultured Sphingomonas sp.]